MSASGETGFQPFVPASEERRELSARALIIGSLLGILFGASSVYLALKIGLTVSASIPIAVLSIPIFKALGRGSILENNITQTTGSAGESIAAGTVFTVPALLIMGYELDITRTTLIAMTGGWLGVMLMIPLRRSLIVKEHGKLAYPEGTACAEVLEAGERKGVAAKLVFLGLAVGILYKFLYKVLFLWKEIPTYLVEVGKGGKTPPYRGVAEMEGSPELLGVGYIIGPRIAGTMAAGGVLSYLVLLPIIYYFGDRLTGALEPATKLISAMSAGEVRSNYIFYVGVGAVASAGIISLIRSLPMIVSTFAATIRGVRAAGVAKGGETLRTERDMSPKVTIGGAIAIVVAIAAIPILEVNLVAALLIVVFGFFFASVSSRICGEIGSSSNPISGMTIATLLLTSVLFAAVGWTGSDYRPIALTVGAIVCVAAANAGATSQDLKTGFLVGATPRRQQIGLLVGVTTSALAVGWTLYFLNGAYTTVIDERAAHPGLYPPVTVPASAPTQLGPDGKEYKRVRLDGDRQRGIPAGRVLVDGNGQVAYSISPAILVAGRDDPKVDKLGIPVQAVDNEGNPVFREDATTGQRTPVWARPEKFDAPKPNLMAIIIDSVLEGRLPWALVLFGVFITLVLELSAVEALAFAVGLYLPLGVSSPIFLGGLVRWMADRRRAKLAKAAKAEGDTGRGTLLASGLIAGGSLCGLIAAGFAIQYGEDGLSIPHLSGSGFLQAMATSDAFAMLLYLGLAAALYLVARKPSSA